MTNINVLQEVKRYSQWLIDIRRSFHKHPELGCEEHWTMQYICKLLDEMDVRYKNKLFTTGIVANIEGIDTSFTVAIRADMDGLPILEKNKKDYASQSPGKMHACGHDVHMAIALGVIKFFYESKTKPPCNIRVIFQPAEENIGGAEPLIHLGVLDGVNVIYGLHVDPDVDIGKIAIKHGAMYATSDVIKIKILGKSSHAAYPHNGVDAIVVAANLINALQTVVSRNTDSRECVVLSFGKIEGGTTGNIIADSVFLLGTLRTLDAEVRLSVLDRIEGIVKNLSLAFDAVGVLEREDGYISVINNKDATEIVEHSVKSILGDSNLIIQKFPSMGTEDFAYYLKKVPGAFFSLGIRNEEKQIVNPLHNGQFDIDESALEYGVSVQVANIYNSCDKKIRN